MLGIRFIKTDASDCGSFWVLFLQRLGGCLVLLHTVKLGGEGQLLDVSFALEMREHVEEEVHLG